LFNAARAAEVADDRVLATKLYAELIKRSPKAANVGEARKRASAINAAIKDSGPGSSCAEQAASKPSTPPAVVVANPPPTAPPPSPTPVVAVDGDPGAGLRIGGIVALAGGGVLAVGGGAMAVVAGLPYLEHGDVAAQIRAAEAVGAAPNTVDALQERQRLARNSWDGWGKIVFPVGVGIAAVGVVSLIAGGVMVPLSMGAE
jgi:hypothetical protein